MLRECFDQSHAERPDIGGRGKRRDGRFGSIVSVKLVRWFAGFADGGERVAGQLELIGGGKNVRRLNARMREAIAVQINESVEHGFEHFAGFGGRESAHRNNLGEVFFGILHHDVKAIPVLEAAAANVEDAEKVRMTELHNAKPDSDLGFGSGSSRNELDGGFMGLGFGELGHEYGGVVRAAEVVAQTEEVINNLTFALSPEIAHSAPPKCGFLRAGQ